MLHNSNNNVKISILILNDAKTQRYIIGFGVSLYVSAPGEKSLETRASCRQRCIRDE